MKIDIKRIARAQGIADVYAVPFGGARHQIERAPGPLAATVDAHVASLAITTLMAVALDPDVAFTGAAGAKLGTLRVLVGDLSLVITANADEREAAVVIVQTGHPIAKSLHRSIRRSWSITPPRRNLAGVVYPTAKPDEVAP